MATRRLASTSGRKPAISVSPAQSASEPVRPTDEVPTTRRFRLFMRQGPWQPTGEVVFRRSWPSRLDAKQEAMDVIADEVVGHGWVTAEDRSWLVLCLDEAITNAMLHGNEGDPRLNVDVAIAIDAKRWYLAISDQGVGFSSAEVPDPEDPNSLLLEHGRGIRLMRAWLSALTYWRKGATVVLSRRRADLG